MVEVLLESGGQEVAVADNGSRAGTPTECPTKDENQITPSLDLSPIQQFYHGETVFITGGTGFLGKLLIEKLLRGCPGIKYIYLLVRPKKGKDVHERSEELFDDPLFEKLKEEMPKLRYQVSAVAGDCSLPGLGISQSDRAMLVREVSIVFHVAATVRFDEKMKQAVAINVRSPRDVVYLCKEMPNLKSLVHVSTAYSNCPYNHIEEKFYDSPIDPDKLMALVECLDEQLLTDITPQLLGVWPNTYAYTKAVAEQVIRKESQDLPVGVFRPAIVTSTYQEPIRGWIDNLYGPMGVAAGAGTGLLRSMHCDGEKFANVVPGDLTVNGLIATAWDVANNYKNSKNSNDIPIYNYVSQDNPITYNQLKEYSAKYGLLTPTTRAIWYYSFRNTKSKLLHMFYVYFLHLLPALLMDTAMFCVGKQPRLLRIYKKIHRFMDVLDYFTVNEWVFSNERLTALVDKLSPEDRKIFFCDIRRVIWDTYFQTYMLGIRLYLIKDPLETLPKARVKWQRLYWCHQAVKVLLAYGAIRLSWAIISMGLAYFDHA